MVITSSTALIIFIMGQRRIGKALVISEPSAENLAH
jgi:hypothetical protein